MNYEHYKICEWAVPSIIAYASVHRNELKEYGKNFCKELSKEQIVNFLFKYGVSTDYNKPATLEQIKRIPEEKLRLCYNSIKWANNLVDISRVKGNNLEIANTDKYTYLLTYSFPCQDLSLAGKCAGMEKGSGTRSGLLWEVERILSECENKPQILLMENVTQVHGAGNEEHFKQWLLRLEEMGYQSYWQDLSATEFKIPQTRNRTFMVSILGNYNYTFPKKTKLELRLKDLLEPEGTVDEKFYISDKMINYISKTGANGFNNKDAKINLDIAKPSFKEVYDKIKNGKFQQQTERIQEKEVCDTLLARDYKDPKLIIEKTNRLGGLYDKNGETHQAGSIYDSDFSSPTLDCSNGGGNRQPFIVEKGEKNKSLKETLEKTELENVKDIAYLDTYNRNAITDGTAKTILTGVDFRNHDFLLIKNATKKGFLEAEEGDGIDISTRMETHRGTVQKGKSQTITTMGGENVGVVVGTYDYAQSDTLRPNEEARLHIGKDVSGTIISSGNHNGIVIKENDSKENLGYTEKSLNKIKKNIVDENDVSGSLTATGMQSLNHDGCQLVSLKRGYSIEVKEEKGETNKVDYIGNYSKSNFNQTSIVGKNGIAPTVTENHGQVTSVTTAFNPNCKTGLRIRKLTPKECFRLQAVKDKDIDLIMKNQSNSLGYHLAGDSICITVLMAIFSKLFEINWLDHFNPEEWWKN